MQFLTIINILKSSCYSLFYACLFIPYSVVFQWQKPVLNRWKQK